MRKVTAKNMAEKSGIGHVRQIRQVCGKQANQDGVGQLEEVGQIDEVGVGQTLEVDDEGCMDTGSKKKVAVKGRMWPFRLKPK